MVFIAYYNILIKHLEIISTSDAELQSSMPYFDRVNALLETPVSDIKRQEVKKIQDIEFRDVSFTYKAGQSNVFTKLNHHIHEGECIEIAGKSGCGKSTFIKLLLGLEHQTEGQILISGQNIENFDKSCLWRRICCIMQDAVLFNTTIRENLLLVKPDATEEELVEVCIRARIMHDIEKMEDGMDTIIGDRGTRLSRGQKQRIIIARSLLQDVDLYVFDEATSGLDPQTESFIYQIVKEIGQKKTVLVITHSGKLTEICNRKIVLEQS